MKHTNRALLLVFLPLFGAFGTLTMQAQTYRITNVPHPAQWGGHGYLDAFSLNLSDAGGANAGQISWLQGGTGSCGVGSGVPANKGFFFLTLYGSPYGCVNAVTYVESGHTQNGTCGGAARGVVLYQGAINATVTVYFSYYRGRYRCYTQIAEGFMERK